jgi:hypothetical protein
MEVSDRPFFDWPETAATGHESAIFAVPKNHPGPQDDFRERKKSHAESSRM